MLSYILDQPSDIIKKCIILDLSSHFFDILKFVFLFLVSCLCTMDLSKTDKQGLSTSSLYSFDVYPDIPQGTAGGSNMRNLIATGDY